MAAIYLIRHGQASFGADNYDQLSELGVQQACVLGKAFAQRLPNPDVILSGDMERHQQTMTHVLAQGITPYQPPQSVCAWNEFDHQKILAAYRAEFATPQGVKSYLSTQKDPQRAFMALFLASIERWLSGQKVEGLETWQEFQQRVISEVQQLSEQLVKQELKSAVVFTSGGPISVIMMQQLGLPKTSLMQVNRMLVNCGVTKLVVSRGKVYLSSSNEHSVFDSQINRHLITYK